MKSRLFVSLLFAACMAVPVAAPATDTSVTGARFGAPLPWLHGCCRVEVVPGRGTQLIVAPGLVAVSAHGLTITSAHGIGLWFGPFDFTAHGPVVMSPEQPNPHLSMAELMHLGAVTPTRSGRLRPYGMVCRGPLGQPTTCRLMTMVDAGHYEAQRFLFSGGLPAGLTRHQADELRDAWKRDRRDMPATRLNAMSPRPQPMATSLAASRTQRAERTVVPPHRDRPDDATAPCRERASNSNRCRSRVRD